MTTMADAPKEGYQPGFCHCSKEVARLFLAPFCCLHEKLSPPESGAPVHHQFRERTFRRERPCRICSQTVWTGIYCRTCRYICHKQCETLVMTTCLPPQNNLHANQPLSQPLPEYTHYEILPVLRDSVTVHREALSHVKRPVPLSSQQPQQGGTPLNKIIMATDVHSLAHRGQGEQRSYGDRRYDLDLHYITERIIAMSFPMEGHEAAYRTNMRDVARMLQTKHGHNYMVLNLSERRNDLTRYNKKVLDYGWPENLAPPLERLCSLCKEIDSWLNSDPQRVVVLHCKGRKSRMGVVIAAFMHYSNICASADQALDRFAMKRFYEDKLGKITQPSQKRYVHYFAGLLSGVIKINSSPLYLHQVVLHGVPRYDDRNGCRPFIKIYLAMEPVYTSGVYNLSEGMSRICFNIEPGLQLRGDVLIKGYHKRLRQEARDVVFRYQFHTCAVSKYGYTILKPELDEACLDRRFPDNGKVELLFASGPSKQGPHFYHDPPPLLVDDSRDTIVRWDSYGDFNKAAQDIPDENGDVIDSNHLHLDHHVQGPLDGSLYATVTKRKDHINMQHVIDGEVLHNSMDSGISSTTGVTGVSVSVVTSQPTHNTSTTYTTSTNTGAHILNNQRANVREQAELDAVLSDLLGNELLLSKTPTRSRQVTSYDRYEAATSSDGKGYTKRSYTYSDSADPSKNVNKTEYSDSNVEALNRLLTLPGGYRQSAKADALDLAMPMENSQTWLEEQQSKLRKSHGRPRTEQEKRLVEELKSAQDKFITKRVNNERSNFYTYIDDQSGYMSEPEGSNYRYKRYSKGYEPRYNTLQSFSTTLVTDTNKPPRSPGLTRAVISPSVPTRTSSRDVITRSRSATRGEWTPSSKPLQRQNSDLSHDRFARSPRTASPCSPCSPRAQSPYTSSYRPVLQSSSSVFSDRYSDVAHTPASGAVTAQSVSPFAYEPRTYVEQRLLTRTAPRQYDSLPGYKFNYDQTESEMVKTYVKKDRPDGTDDHKIYSQEGLGDRLEELERSLQAAQNAISAEAALRREKELREAKEKEAREREAREKETKERMEREAKEWLEREARERIEREAREKMERDRMDREAREREARDREDRLRRERDIIEREIREREIIEIRDRELRDLSDGDRLAREARDLERQRELDRRERELLEKERQLRSLQSAPPLEREESGTRTITRTYLVEPSKQAIEAVKPKVSANRRRSSVEDVYLLKPIGVHTLETDGLEVIHDEREVSPGLSTIIPTSEGFGNSRFVEATVHNQYGSADSPSPLHHNQQYATTSYQQQQQQQQPQQQRLLEVHKRHVETRNTSSPQLIAQPQQQYQDSQRVEGRRVEERRVENRFDYPQNNDAKFEERFESRTIKKEHQEHGPEVFVESGGSSLSQSFDAGSAGGNFRYTNESRSATLPHGSGNVFVAGSSSSLPHTAHAQTASSRQFSGSTGSAGGHHGHQEHYSKVTTTSSAQENSPLQVSFDSPIVQKSGYTYSSSSQGSSTGSPKNVYYSESSSTSPIVYAHGQSSAHQTSGAAKQQYSWSAEGSSGSKAQQSFSESSSSMPADNRMNQSWSEGSYSHGERYASESSSDARAAQGANGYSYQYGVQNGRQAEPPMLMVDTSMVSHTRSSSGLSTQSQLSPASPNTYSQIRGQLSKESGGTSYLSPPSQGSPATSTYAGMSRQASMQSLAFVDTIDMINHTPKFVKDLSKYWYKPNISREDAINLLKDKPEGTFVVRDSNSFPGAFGLALKVSSLPPNVQPKGDPETELVRHFLIESTSKGVRMKGCNNEPVFGSLSTLVYQHTITPLALPCKLVLPDVGQQMHIVMDETDTSKQEVPGSAQALLAQGAACNVLFIYSVDTELLTGPQALARAMAETKAVQPKTTEVHFKVSSQGITLTDNLRKLFFRRHYPVNSVTYCGMDPDDTRWLTKQENGKEITAKVFGFVARKSGSQTDNCCHIFAELDPDQPASAIVNFVTKIMIGSAAQHTTHKLKS